MGLQPPKITKIGNFWYKFALKRYTPLSNFYKIWVGEGLPGLHRHVKCGFKKCWLTATKIAKIGNFWYIFASRRYIPLINFFTKFGVREGLQRNHNHANLHFCGFKNVALRLPKSPKLVIFGINFPQKGIPSYVIFVKFCLGEVSLPRANFFIYRGNVSPLWGENPIFGQVSKNNTGMASLRAGLPVTKKTSHFFVYSRRATHDHHHTWHGDRAGLSHFCTP